MHESGGATGRGGSMNKGVVAGRWWNMATGIARWQKREKEPRGLGRERGTTFERQRQRERERERSVYGRSDKKSVSITSDPFAWND